jgi:phosphoribosylanthranilate isomerase
MRTRIKICGLTREQDVEAAVEAGVDALGFVFYSQSPRSVSPHRARELIRRVPAWIATVGLFVNAPRQEILSVADQAGISHIQLHGDESPEDCGALGRPVVKALRVKTGLQGPSEISAEVSRLSGLVRAYAGCQALLFDSESAGFGGSGQAFDWAVLEAVLAQFPVRNTTWVLSGGLESGCVGNAVARLSPPCVDVSSGVESLKDGKPLRGIKDPARIASFVDAVRASSN